MPTWSCFFLACHPRNFRGISTGNTCVLFTLVSRGISCYLFFSSVQFSQLYRYVKGGLQINIQHKLSSNHFTPSEFLSWVRVPSFFTSCRQGLEYAGPILDRLVRLSSKRCIQGMTLNCIKRWGSSSEIFESMEYSFIGITPRSTLT